MTNPVYENNNVTQNVNEHAFSNMQTLLSKFQENEIFDKRVVLHEYIEVDNAENFKKHAAEPILDEMIGKETTKMLCENPKNHLKVFNMMNKLKEELYEDSFEMITKFLTFVNEYNHYIGIIE